VSGDDRRNATSSIESQLVDCRRFAEHRGYEVVGEYFEQPDKATSGADWLPELEKLIRLAPSGIFDVLICREVDRLARNRFKQLATEIELENHGVRVEYAVGQFEDSPEGRLLKGLVSEFAEYERDKIRRRTQAGTLRSVQSGNVTIGGGITVYGYDVVTVTALATDKTRRTLVINEAEAAVVRQVFEMYAGGMTLYGIRDWLDEHKVPKPGKAAAHRARSDRRNEWSHGTVNRILKNEAYTGTWHYRKARNTKDPKTGKRRNIPRPRSEWLAVAVPRIVSDELFTAVQQRREANKAQLGHQHRTFYALGGMLTCGDCGKSITGIARSNERRYYRCAAKVLRKRYGIKCPSPMYRADQVEAAVWSWIKSLLLEPDMLRQALENYQQQQRDRVQPQLAMLDSTQARLGEVEGRKERLITAYTTGVLSLDELATQKAALDKEMADLTAAIAALRSESESRLLSAEQIESIETVAAEIRAGADEADDNLAAQREIFRLLNVHVILSYDGERRWADISCIFDSRRVAADYITDCRQAFALAAPVGRWQTMDVCQYRSDRVLPP
jgi:DNA invertase Pin-like site-specific DNA recombinase